MIELYFLHYEMSWMIEGERKMNIEFGSISSVGEPGVNRYWDNRKCERSTFALFRGKKSQKFHGQNTNVKKYSTKISRNKNRFGKNDESRSIIYQCSVLLVSTLEILFNGKSLDKTVWC